MATVIRLRKRQGQTVQDCDVYIGRACSMGWWDLPESPWHNPFRLSDYGNDRRRVLELYRQHVLQSPLLLAQLPSLKGQRLGCWCHDHDPQGQPIAEPYCHGDVLVNLLLTN